MFNKKAQGAMEYLLIIGAAILVVAVVIVAITGVLGTGKTNATTQSTDSAYTGLRDILDLGKGKTILYLQLKAGDNEIIFQTNFANNTIEDVFQNLPTYSVIQFNDSPNCGTVDANKRNSKWEIQNTAGYTGLNLNDASSCQIVSLKKIKVIVPQDTNMGVSEEIIEQPIRLNEDGDSNSIQNCYDLQEMNKDLSKSYYLKNDIDCSMTEKWNNGAGFEPIGKYSTNQPFVGNFDGNRKKIENLYINRPDSNNIALFGYAKDSEIKDLSLTDVSINGKGFVGSLVGYYTTTNKSTIQKIFVSGKINGVFHVGGIVGDNNYGNLYKLKSSVDVSGGNVVGGIVSYSYSGDIKYSSSQGKMKCDSNQVGGLVGNFVRGDLNESFSSANINGSDSVGGLVGRTYMSGINDSYFFGSVSGATNSGGLVGIANHYHLRQSIFTNSYSRGKVNNNTSDGIFGKKDRDIYTINLYFDINESESSYFKDTTFQRYTYQMKNYSNYINWNFQTIWEIDGTNQINDGYPYLINNLPN